MVNRSGRRAFWAMLLIGSAAYFAFVCVYLSAHRMMWADEFDAWHLLADPSWKHAFASWVKGADGGPPLYYAIGRVLLAITGLHPVVMRLYSAACLWLAAVLFVQILRRYFAGWIAVAAACLVFLCNPEFVDQLGQIRFYGQMVLAVTVVMWVALRLEDARPSARVWFGASLLAGAFLVTSHPLGIVYSAAILFAQMFGKAPARNRVAALLGTLLSWTALLMFLPALRSGAQTTNWLSMPNLAALMHFYDNHPLIFAHGRYVSVVINLVLLCVIAYASVWLVRNFQSDSTRPDSFRLLLFIGGVLLLMPIGLFVVSHVYKPLFLGRYLLPYSLGFACLAAAGISLLTERFAIRVSWLTAAIACAPLVVIALLTFKQQALYPVSDLEPVLRLAQSMPTAVQDDGTVLEAHFYAPERATNLFYVMLPPKPGEKSTLYSVAAQGYEPSLVFDDVFFKAHRQFLYVDNPAQPRFFREDMLGNPHWKGEDVGTVVVRGEPVRVIRYTRVDDVSSADSPAASK